MEKNLDSDRRWGPSPGRATPRLSDSRLRILAQLRDQPEPVTRAALTAASGLHENTVREHLDGLVRHGLVRRTRAAPTGRGRPAWLYEAAPEGAVSEYATLAAVLAATLARTSKNPREDATAAGEEWGHQLMRSRSGGGAAAGPIEARAEVMDLLGGPGLLPRTRRGGP